MGARTPEPGTHFRTGWFVFGVLVLVAVGKLVFDYVTHVSLIPLAWSPDGNWVLVNVENDLAETTGSVGLASAKTGRLERIIFENRGGLACYRAAFSPDSRLVAFGHMGFHIVDLATDKHREISVGNLPAWFSALPNSLGQLESKSPDGKWIARVVTRVTGEDTLYCARTSRMAQKCLAAKVSFYAYAKAPEWSATNEVIYWDTQAKLKGIYAVAPATGKKRFLTGGYASLISPNGKRLAYVQNGDLKFLEIGTNRIFEK